MFKNNLPSGKSTWNIYLPLVQVFSVSVRSNSDSEHQRTFLLWLYNHINTYIFVVVYRTGILSPVF